MKFPRRQSSEQGDSHGNSGEVERVRAVTLNHDSANRITSTWTCSELLASLSGLKYMMSIGIFLTILNETILVVCLCREGLLYLRLSYMGVFSFPNYASSLPAAEATIHWRHELALYYACSFQQSSPSIRPALKSLLLALSGPSTNFPKRLAKKGGTVQKWRNLMGPVTCRGMRGDRLFLSRSKRRSIVYGCSFGHIKH